MGKHLSLSYYKYTKFVSLINGLEEFCNLDFDFLKNLKDKVEFLTRENEALKKEIELLKKEHASFIETCNNNNLHFESMLIDVRNDKLEEAKFEAFKPYDLEEVKLDAR